MNVSLCKSVSLRTSWIYWTLKLIDEKFISTLIFWNERKFFLRFALFFSFFSWINTSVHFDLTEIKRRTVVGTTRRENRDDECQRSTETLDKWNSTEGFRFDDDNGWNFNSDEFSARAEVKIDSERKFFLVFVWIVDRFAFHSEFRLNNDRQLLFLNTDDVRSRNREQLIEKLERVIQEKNASIIKLEER